MRSDSAQGLVYTGREGLASLDEQGIGYKTEAVFPSYRVTRLDGKFVNRATRARAGQCVGAEGQVALVRLLLSQMPASTSTPPESCSAVSESFRNINAINAPITGFRFRKLPTCAAGRFSSAWL